MAYAGCPHLNLVAFHNIAYEVITVGVTSDELQGAVALSLCVNDLKGDVSVL
jgi:hypothetical protein